MPLLLYGCHNTVQSVNECRFCYMDVIISPVCQQMQLLLYGYHHHTVQSVNKGHFCYMNVIIQSSRSTKATYVILMSQYSLVCLQMPLLLYGCHNTVQSVYKCHFCHMDVNIIQSSLSTNATSVIWMST